MTIGTYQAFLNLTQDLNNPHIVELRNCLNAVNKICACQKQLKAKKANDCNDIYVRFVTTHVPNLLDYFRRKTTDDVIVFNQNTHHEIKRLVLR
jgi:hypothetical protein